MTWSTPNPETLLHITTGTGYAIHKDTLVTCTNF